MLPQFMTGAKNSENIGRSDIYFELCKGFNIFKI